MLKKMLVLSLMAPTLLLAETEFHCVPEESSGEITTVFVHVTLKSADPTQTQFKSKVQGFTQVSGLRLYTEYTSTYGVEFNYKRKGYTRSYQSKLPNGPEVYIAEEAFQNEGPVKRIWGTLTYNPGQLETRILLHCE